MADDGASKEEQPDDETAQETNHSSKQGSIQEQTSNTQEEDEDEPNDAKKGDTDDNAENIIIPEKTSSEITDEINAIGDGYGFEDEGEWEEEETMQDEKPVVGPIGEDDVIVPEVSDFNIVVDYDEEIEEEEETVSIEDSSSVSEVDLNLKLDRAHLKATFEEIYKYKKHAERRKFLLNRKVSEYYRRQQNYGVFNQESLTVHKDYIQRYRTQLLEMDKRLANKRQFAIDSRNQIGPLKNAIEETKNEYKSYCESFAKNFFDTAITLQASASGKELKETTVSNILKRMANVRNIINVERLEFIKTENLVAEIEVKAKTLEDLGNGLRMVDFEQLRSETQSLSDKIEERNNELEKLRLRCNADTQILAHVREKDFMLHNTIQSQKEIMKQIKEEVDIARERCNQLKMERDTFRKKHNELSYECGLLDKPLLLRDFDITDKAIEMKKKEIAQLQVENAKIENAVHRIAIILSEGEMIKTDAQKFQENLLREISYMDAPIFPRIKKPQ